MTDLTKFEFLGVGDLKLVCENKGIKVTEEDNRDTLLQKLQPKSKPTD